jgi:hypothetical protein
VKAPLPHTHVVVFKGWQYPGKVYSTGAGLFVDNREGMVGLHELTTPRWKI